VESAKAELARLQRGTSGEERAALEANVKAAQASRDLVAAQIKNAALLAPFAGEVIKVNLGKGEYAAPGAPVVLLADSSAWRLETTGLTELNVADVSPGMPVSVTFDAIPGLELTGRISAIEPYGETKQGDIVYTATILLEQQDPRLRWNMTGKVKIG
jgi:HlyD family secretion protein